jgi:alpha-amylase
MTVSCISNLCRMTTLPDSCPSAILEVNLNFGTPEDLKALSDALHERGMYLMVDVVVNHVGSPRWRQFRPDERYGALNEPEDYHPHCWIQNYDNQTEVEQCWIGEDQREALVDVNTESPKVVREMYRWIRQLVSEYGIDGLRVDTVKHGESPCSRNSNTIQRGEI